MKKAKKAKKAAPKWSKAVQDYLNFHRNGWAVRTRLESERLLQRWVTLLSLNPKKIDVEKALTDKHVDRVFQMLRSKRSYWQALRKRIQHFADWLIRRDVFRRHLSFPEASPEKNEPKKQTAPTSLPEFLNTEETCVPEMAYILSRYAGLPPRALLKLKRRKNGLYVLSQRTSEEGNRMASVRIQRAPPHVREIYPRLLETLAEKFGRSGHLFKGREKNRPMTQEHLSRLFKAYCRERRIPQFTLRDVYMKGSGKKRRPQKKTAREELPDLWEKPLPPFPFGPAWIQMSREKIISLAAGHHFAESPDAFIETEILGRDARSQGNPL